MNRSYKRTENSPSFSSSLLEKVFRSIDEGDELVSASNKNQIISSISSNGFELHRSSTEKKRMKKVGTNRRKFETDFTAAAKAERNRTASLKTQPQPPPNVIGLKNLKPIRTSTVASNQSQFQSQTQSCVYPEATRNSSMPAKRETPSPPSASRSFQNAKCRAARIYSELKNVKQPISPGGKLTRFITSLFSKRSSSNKSDKVREVERGAEALATTRRVPVTCSSASSYCRSRLNNKSSLAASSVVIEDDGSQHEHRFNPRLVSYNDPTRGSDMSRYKQSVSRCYIPSPKSFSQESNDIKRSPKCDPSKEIYCLKDLLEKYNKNGAVLTMCDKLKSEDHGVAVEGDDDDDDEGDGDGDGDGDGGSCASSDLFELDHINGGNANGGMNDELPVYETTSLFHSKNPALW